MISGYIMLARKLLNNPIMNKPPEYFKTWIFLLLKANFTDVGNLKRGEGFTSIDEIAEYLSYYKGYAKIKPSRKQVWGIIDWLRRPHEGDNEGNDKGTMIVTTKVTHGIVYSVLKYDLYQSSNFYEGNSEGNDEKLTKELRRERQGNNINKKGNNKEDSMSEFGVSLRGKDIGSESDLVLPEKKSNKEIDDFFETIWQLYPIKKGKAEVKPSAKRELYKLGFDKIKSAIEKYTKETTPKYYMHGRRFFNTSYIDYVTCDSTPKKQEIKFIEVDADDYRDNFEKYYKP
jgi:hypothetical protein